MRIHVLGGGPAGLFLALLAKRRIPRCEVEVFERDPPGNTFGFGIVFSGRTLGFLERADPVFHAALMDRLTIWDGVDILHRGETITIAGNEFSGCGRASLLECLHEQCEAAGVALHLGAEVPDPLALPPADLLVGADGAHSRVRETFGAAFGAHVDIRPNRFLWLGTPKRFRNLTLGFFPTPYGVLCLHAHEYGDGSSFIVECSDATYHRAGFHERPLDETLARLETALASALDGHGLRSNASRWLQFRVVRNARWAHGGAVLLGDAAHTAHFSIGSGTKLAMESAIALADALEAAPGALPDALAAFERARRPAVETLQYAAFKSMRWFETIDERAHLEPLAMAYSAMTRSGRLDRAVLERRDPAFAARVGPLLGAEAG